ncbi:GlxA family transcriptional regulator [Paraburkholderia sp. Ac-20342]|uniref:GlxA family transcriptional regulator n=1 Tax=Paraburkholderia sp. Ac-20342 TaxID=2703889 RepID=UPI00197D938D|nr:GlxA family transcriptional regulator [Paraburkholderia sp. Ac-20342]MBN3846923.1 GlxA family transcriptional regulator [Paraburkholderia sp. Ac-20342]
MEEICGPMKSHDKFKKMISGVRNFSFLLIPNFTMNPLVNAIEVLRLANQLGRKDLFKWTLYSEGGGAIESSNGISFQTKVIQDAPLPDILFICAGNDVHRLRLASCLSLVRKFAASGVLLGGMCTGSFVLAKAGLLDGYSCTIHWEYLTMQKEMFHRVKFEKRIFVVDRDRITCIGGTASLDMMLHLIDGEIGSDLKKNILEFLVIESIRGGESLKPTPKIDGYGFHQDILRSAIEIMENNVEEPLSCEELSRRIGISTRQLQRIFGRNSGGGIKRCYIAIRLRRARERIVQSNMNISDISIASGFHSLAHFSQSYKDFFGLPPTEDRRLAQTELKNEHGDVGNPLRLLPSRSASGLN